MVSFERYIQAFLYSKHYFKMHKCFNFFNKKYKFTSLFCSLFCIVPIVPCQAVLGLSGRPRHTGMARFATVGWNCTVCRSGSQACQVCLLAGQRRMTPAGPMLESVVASDRTVGVKIVLSSLLMRNHEQSNANPRFRGEMASKRSLLLLLYDVKVKKVKRAFF